MQRISFDFMTRRLRQTIRENLAMTRKHKDAPTAEALQKKVEHAKWLKQFIPETRYGSRLVEHVSDKDSRPVRRYKMRMTAFNRITDKYPGESRKTRRRMAFDSIRHNKTPQLLPSNRKEQS